MRSWGKKCHVCVQIGKFPASLEKKAIYMFIAEDLSCYDCRNVQRDWLSSGVSRNEMVDWYVCLFIFVRFYTFLTVYQLYI